MNLNSPTQKITNSITDCELRLYPLNLIQLALTKGKVRRLSAPFLKYALTGMEITINNSSREIINGSTLHNLVYSQLGDKQKGIAVAVNDTVIPKANWEGYILQSNDSILIIKATQGG